MANRKELWERKTRMDSMSTRPNVHYSKDPGCVLSYIFYIWKFSNLSFTIIVSSANPKKNSGLQYAQWFVGEICHIIWTYEQIFEKWHCDGNISVSFYLLHLVKSHPQLVDRVYKVKLRCLFHDRIDLLLYMKSCSLDIHL